MNNTVKLNESQLRKIVAESVKKVLKESDINNTDFDMSPYAVAMRNRYKDSINKQDYAYTHPDTLKSYVIRLNAEVDLLSRSSSEKYRQIMYDSMRQTLNEMLKAINHISSDFDRLIDDEDAR